MPITEAEERNRILQEIYRYQGIHMALVGGDVLKHKTFHESSHGRRNWSLEDLRGDLAETRERIGKLVEAQGNPVVHYPWPELGAKVWSPFSQATRTEPCLQCKGNAQVVVEGASYKCTTCHGNGTRSVSDVIAIETTVVKADYSRSGGAEGWGEVKPDLYIQGLLLWWVDEHGTKWSAKDADEAHLHRTREDCDRDIAKRLKKGWSRDAWPRWQRA